MNLSEQNLKKLVNEEIEKRIKNKNPKRVILLDENKIVGVISKGPYSKNTSKLSEGLKYHIEKDLPLSENVYRPFTEKWYNLFNEARDLNKKGSLFLSESDQELLNSDIGMVGIYNGQEVPLDAPMQIEQDIFGAQESTMSEAEYQGKDVDLNKPKRNSSDSGGQYVVYVKDGDKVKRITYGSRDMKGNWNDPEARKSFAARHQCDKKKDKTKAGYWSCRAHKDFGKNVSGRFW